MSELLEGVLLFVGGMASLTLAYQRYSVTRKKDATEVASESAKTAQYELLEASIKRNDERIRDLTVEFNAMDRKLHRQQRTITRMEMLLRQFSGLVSQNGMTVPAWMQAELDELIEADADIRASAEPRSFP
jgi:Flp pilus assembly protein TadB